MNITIDGKKLSAEEGETILEVARRAAIDIPTLCHHDALEPVGACRVCVVEIAHADDVGGKRIVTACQYPVEDGMTVWTKSPLVVEQRQTTLSLLVARCPNVKAIRDMAEQYGGEVAEYTSFDEDEKCILCYLCTRTCAAVGPEAIAAVGRGKIKEIAPPFHGAAEACIGCGSCARVCPTGCIEMVDEDGKRRIWGRELELITCDSCGAPIITKAYRDHAVQAYDLDESYYTTCAACKRTLLAKRMSGIGVIDGAGE